MPPQRCLTTSMRDMTLNEDEDSTPKAKERPLAVDLGVLYPKLPSDWYENDRYWVLGWDANHPRLKAYVEDNSPPDIAEDIPYYIRVLDLLEWSTHFRPIQLCTVLPDDAPIPPLTGKDEVPRIMLVAICFTARLHLYKRRPSKEQYKWLKQLFGCRPRWYRDSFPKNEFHLHLIE